MRALFLAIAACILLGSDSSHAAPTIQNALYPGGVQAAHILDLWHLTLAICTLVLIAVVGATLYAMRRAPYANRETAPDIATLSRDEPAIRRGVLLATGLSILLLFILLIADVFTERALARMPVQDALHIELIGHQWWWEAHYDDPEPAKTFTVANELHIPVGKPIIITLKSSDVIHSFWVPNLHGKKDLIPGRVAKIQLRADEPGIYRGQCAEFCGHEHALMALLMVAEPQTQYDAWADLQRQAAPQPSDEQLKRGQQVFLSSTCAMCHNIGGLPASATLGPDLTHLASRKTIAAGTLPNDKAHLAAWIIDPHKYKPGVNMPANALNSEDMDALLAYLGTLK